MLGEVDDRGEAAIDAAAELLQLTPAHVRVALSHYGNEPGEIAAEPVGADAASGPAEDAWRAEQRLLA